MDSIGLASVRPTVLDDDHTMLEVDASFREPHHRTSILLGASAGLHQDGLQFREASKRDMFFAYGQLHHTDEALAPFAAIDAHHIALHTCFTNRHGRGRFSPRSSGRHFSRRGVTDCIQMGRKRYICSVNLDYFSVRELVHREPAVFGCANHL